MLQAMIEAHRHELLSAMPQVNEYQEELKSLRSWWNIVSLIGKVNCDKASGNVLLEMEDTQKKFSELQKTLVHHLILENLQKIILNDSSIAQVSIDILIRNLFERTADVGFLATDDDIRCFLLNRDKTEKDQKFIIKRLQEYVKKYSVYDEIIVLDPQGRVQVHLNERNRIIVCNDPLIRKTLSTTEEFVEAFGQTDLQPGVEHALIYAGKITASNEPNSAVLGVLCLCFRFDDEIAGIFQNMALDPTCALVLLNDEGRVMISSKPDIVAESVRFVTKSPYSVVTHENEAYIKNTAKTKGYQGFYGLGWAGQVMTPLKTAFKYNKCKQAHQVSNAEVQLFSDELKDIQKSSLDINKQLRLIMFNGKTIASRNNLKELVPVLDDISKISEETAKIFSASIEDLQATAISSQMNDAQFIAGLAIDIMDRNLYERANDCRWWALTSTFREILAKDKLSTNDGRVLTDILSYINALYTVYTNVFLYDLECRVIAVSNPAENRALGKTLPEDSGAQAALYIRDSQKYAVSGFVETPLYDNRPTYIYNASVTDLHNSGSIVGGIGVVFDSEVEFKAMLTDALPVDHQGQTCQDCFAVYTNRAQHILAVTTHSTLQVGDVLGLDRYFFSLKNGHKESQVIEYEQSTYALGVAVSKGYREYKTTDGYENDVLAFVFLPF